MSKKTSILIDLRGRQLSDDEANELRAFVSELRPKVHLVMANWPWLEVRGLSESSALELVERVRRFAPHCVVTGLERSAASGNVRRRQASQNVKTDRRKSARKLSFPALLEE